MKIVEDSTDILCIQDPYTIQDKTAGIPKRFKIFTSGKGRNRAATVVTNNHIDTLLITQLSDVDAVVVEVILGNLKIILAKMYFDIGQQIEVDLAKLRQLYNTLKEQVFS
jgi:hypothetical protein